MSTVLGHKGVHIFGQALMGTSLWVLYIWGKAKISGPMDLLLVTKIISEIVLY